MDASLALYRRYRPDTYADVIGQEHVTDPLRQALRNNRVNHAYLFSGPRGCGKTTSARILARCLNCNEGPTPDPCGECQSCRDLARGGPGSIDVIEIDAASHGGVDDARDLRERAFFAPVSARYKIYIVDEAHMVTTQGFNALLKLVEEPPDHLKFIFATTEPDKVIGTIRSRTHHYPFRLVPPKLLQDYLAELCAGEGVRLDPAALPLVVRAGAGSVRDTLSILDQLLGGAGDDGVSYRHAVALLGYTPDSLLDDAIEALASRDGGGIFGAVDKVIESGQDPKRFGEDLLRRLRDLVVLSAVPDAGQRGLIDGAPEVAEQLAAQAGRFGPAELTRAADVLHAGLTEMRGATAPRLQLELICARMLLPDATDAELGMHARLERLEAAVRSGATPAAAGGPAAPPDAQPTQPAPSAPPAQASREAQPVQPAQEAQPVQPAPSTQEALPAQADEPAPAAQPAWQNEAAQPWSAPAASAPTAAAPSASGGAADGQSAGPAPPASAAPSGGGPGFAELRQRWEQVLDAVARRRRFTWIVLSQNGHLVAVEAGTVTVGFVNAGARDSFNRGGSDEILQQALSDVFGGAWQVEAVVDPGGGNGGGSGQQPGGGGGGQPPAGAAPAGAGSGGRAPAGAPPGTPDPSAGPSEASVAGAAGGAGVGGANGSIAATAAAGQTAAASATEWPEPARVPGSGAQPAAEGPSPDVAASAARGAPGSTNGSAGATAPGVANGGGRAVGVSTGDAPGSAPAAAQAAPTPEAGRAGTAAVAGGPVGEAGPGAGGPSAYVTHVNGNAAGHGLTEPEDEVDPETDAAATSDPVNQVDLLSRELGAQIIEEHPNR